jgi:hypothetical protein
VQDDAAVMQQVDGTVLTWYTEDDADEFRVQHPHGKGLAVRKLTPKDYRRFNATMSHSHLANWHHPTEKKVAKDIVSIGDSLVSLYERNGENRSYAISTKAADEMEFVDEMARRLAALMPVSNRELWTLRLREWLPLAVDICCKYRGYKAETVKERRELLAGDLVPDSTNEVK